MKGQVEFDEAAHRYTVNGVPVPSVTQVIGGVIPYNFYNATEWHMERGRALHKAIHLHLQSRLDRTSIDPVYEGKFCAYEKFMRETKATVVNSKDDMPLIEIVMGTNRYAGTMDVVLDLPGVGVTLTDWKGSVSPQNDIQLGGYVGLIDQYKLAKVAACVAVQLNDDGGYSCRWVKGKTEISNATALFMSALNLYGWMKREKLLKEDRA